MNRFRTVGTLAALLLAVLGGCATAPASKAETDEVLLETIFLSVDPAMRSWMREDPGYQPEFDTERSAADYVGWLRAGHER